MPKVNTAGSGHVAPVPNSGWQWLAYAVGSQELSTLNRAIFIIDNRIKGYKPCDKAFKALPGGRTFTDIWADPNIWVSRDPRNVQGLFGATNAVGGTEITITQFALRMGRWTVAATLVHELAHSAGADAVTADAESTLISCLLSGLRDPNIIGALQTSSGTRLA